MAVDIELYGQILPDAPRRQTLELEDSTTVRGLIARLDLTSEEIGLITINNVQSELDDMVPSDCRICFFPYVSGG